MARRILHLAKTTRDSRDARALGARRDYKLASLAAFGRSLRENKHLTQSKSVHAWELKHCK